MASTTAASRRPADERRRFLRLLSSSWVTYLFVLVAVAVLALAVQGQPALSISMAQQGINPLLNGFYGVERVGGRVYRWSQGSAAIRFPEAGLPSPLVLVLRAAGGRPEGVPLTITVGNPSLHPIAVGQGFATYAVVLPVSGRARALTVGLLAPTFSPSSDRRMLGVAIERIELRAPLTRLPILPLRPLLLLSTFAFALYGVFLRLVLKPWLATLLAAPFLALEVLAVRRSWMALLAHLNDWTALVGGVVVLLFLFAPELRRDGQRLGRSLARGRPGARAGPATQVPGYLAWTVRLAALAVLVVHLLPSYLPVEQGPYESYSWGIRFFARFPWGWQWAAVGLAAALCLASAPLARSWVWLARRLPRPRRLNGYLWALALAVLAVGLFWLLRTRCYSGDWLEIVGDISRGMLWRERSPLDFLLRSVLGRALSPHWPRWLRVAPPLGHCLVHPVPTEDPFGSLRPLLASISCLAGGIFVGAVVGMGRFLFRVRPERWMFVALVIGQGTLLLFCGYIEMYTLVTAAMAVYLLTAVLALQGRVSLLWPVLALTIAVGCHLQALFLAPSLMVLVMLRFAAERRGWPGWLGGVSKVVLASLLLLCVLAGALLAAGYDPSRLGAASQRMGGIDSALFKHLVLPKPLPREPYPILSWAHLRAVLNQQLLLAPLSLLVGMAIVLLLGRRVGRSDPLAWFLLAAALPALLFSLVYNPDLGAAQDWDLLSPPFFLVTVCAAYLLLARARPARLRLSAAIPWLAVSLLHTTAWLVANRLGL